MLGAEDDDGAGLDDVGFAGDGGGGFVEGASSKVSGSQKACGFVSGRL